MTQQTDKTGGRLLILDGVRGLAAILVVLFHLQAIGYPQLALFGHGYLAVDLFFILSGFVLTRAFEPKLRDGLGLVAFTRLRIERLWPTLTVGFLIGAVAVGLNWPLEKTLIALAMTMVLIPTTKPGSDLYPLNGPTWSLALELLANVAHGAILYRLSNRMLLGICALAGGGLVWAAWQAGSLNLGVRADTFGGGLIRTAFSYTLGIYMARTWTRQDRWGGGGASQEPTRRWMIALGAPVAVMLAPPLLPESMRWMADTAIVLIAFPLMFRACTRAAPPAWAAPWLHWLGAISYPVYAVHIPLLLLSDSLREAWLPDTSRNVFIAAALVTIFALAGAMALAAERKAEKRQGQRAAVAATATG